MMATRRSLRSKIENNLLNNNKIKDKEIDDDDGSSSDSSVGNYLKTADEIDLNSSFFTVQPNNISHNSSTNSNKRKSDIGRLSDLSNSDSETEPIKDENKDVITNETVSDFQNLHNFNKKLEETRLVVQKYEKKRAKKETKQEISNLLSLGEKPMETSAIINQENFITDSEDEMDWEDVEHSIDESINNIPKEGVEITVALPGRLREKKTKDDIMMSMKRKINRIKKENQVYIHKVNLLCWIAHGNCINSILNNENLLGVSLSLLPSEQCYPPKHADLKYLEQITKWFGKVIKIKENDLKENKLNINIGSLKNKSKIDNKLKLSCKSEENLPLYESLEIQLTKKEANSKKHFVYMYICILRALGLSCRLILSLQPVPLRPPSSELCSLSTKSNVKNEKTEHTKSGKTSKSMEKKVVRNENKTKDSNTEKSNENDTKSGGKSKGGDIKNQENTKSDNKSGVRTRGGGSCKSAERIGTKSGGKIKDCEIKGGEITKGCEIKSGEKTKGGNNKREEKTKDVEIKSRNRRSVAKSEIVETKKPSTRASTSGLELKSNTNDTKVERGRSKRSKSSINYSTADDSEEDFKLKKRNTSESSRSTIKSKCQLDIRSDIVKLIKGDMLKAKHAESEKLVNKIKKEESDDSDYIPEEPVIKKCKSKTDSEDDFKSKKSTVRKPSKSKVDSRVLSTDSDEKDDGKKKVKNGNDVWAEVFLEAEEKWISVDVIKGQVHCVSELYSRATSPVCYILAWNNNRSIKDVTSRYCPHMNTVTRKMRVETEWWNKTLKPYIGKKTARDKEEDEDLARQQLDQPLPKIISEYKNHPLYALKRHLLKFEAIYPPDAMTLGFIRNEPVYARECVHTLHSREIWLKHAKVVKLGEQAYKIVKARPKYDKLSGQMITDKPLEIFGMWQVEDYEPPTAENGIVPRNAFGNVELFKPCMLPKKTVHLQLPGLNKVARKLRIDCAPALTGFDYHSGGCHPTYDGFVVCEEFKDTLIAAWEEDQEETYAKEMQKIEKRVYDNWRKLIKGVLIRERLKVKYEFESMSSKGKKSKKGPKVVTKKRRVVSDSESD